MNSRELKEQTIIAVVIIIIYLLRMLYKILYMKILNRLVRSKKILIRRRILSIRPVNEFCITWNDIKEKIVILKFHRA